MTHFLEAEFTGKGEVKGFKFKRVYESETAYIYRVTFLSKSWFEVFKRTTTPICIDFANKIFSETEFN
jgi:hypothetical protein